MQINATIVLETKVLRNLGFKKIHLSWLITVLKELRWLIINYKLCYNLRVKLHVCGKKVKFYLFFIELTYTRPCKQS